VETAVEPEASFLDMKALLATVRQEIAATGMMAIRESATLLELVHVQNAAVNEAIKEAANKAEYADRAGYIPDNTEPSDNLDNPRDSQDAGKTRAWKKEEVNAVIQENISSLQQAFHQEIGRLRHELVRD
jgi:hypothetical protein